MKKTARDVKDLILAGEWNEEYARQRDSQKKVMADRRYAGAATWRFEKKHGDDHGNDCYCMALTIALQRHWLLGHALEAQESEELKG